MRIGREKNAERPEEERFDWEQEGIDRLVAEATPPPPTAVDTREQNRIRTFTEAMTSIDDIDWGENQETYVRLGEFLVKAKEELDNNEMYQISYLEFRSQELFTPDQLPDRAFNIVTEWKTKNFRKQDIYKNYATKGGDWDLDEIMTQVGRPVKFDWNHGKSKVYFNVGWHKDRNQETHSHYSVVEEEYDDSEMTVYIKAPGTILQGIKRLED
jgi:hypothetical protein